MLAFLGRHWRRHPALLACVMLGMLLATAADVLVPVFAGRLIDAIAQASDTGREQALGTALRELAVLAVLGLFAMAARMAGIVAICSLTLRIMSSVGTEAFHRVQRLSSEWHANSFAGSTVRQVTRGMWAIDVLNDTLLLALLSSAAMLLGAVILMGWQWPAMGLLIAAGGSLYVGLTIAMSLGMVAPAARLSNHWDTRVSGAMADAIGANAVVKGFGAEAREDTRLGLILAKWRRRTRRTWNRAVAAEAIRHSPWSSCVSPWSAWRSCSGGTSRRRRATSRPCSPCSSWCRAICARSASTSTTSNVASARWRSWSHCTRRLWASRTTGMRNRS